MKLFNEKILRYFIIGFVINVLGQSIEASQVVEFFDQTGLLHRTTYFDNKILIQTFGFKGLIFESLHNQPTLYCPLEQQEDAKDDVFFDALDFIPASIKAQEENFKEEFPEFDIAPFIVSEDEMRKILARNYILSFLSPDVMNEWAGDRKLAND